MRKFVYLFLCAFFFGCGNNKNISSSVEIDSLQQAKIKADSIFQHFLGNFAPTTLPHSSDSNNNLLRFSKEDSTYWVTKFHDADLISVEDSALQAIEWNSADYGSITNAMYPGKMIYRNDKFILLDASDDDGFSMGMLFTITNEGKFINGLVCSYLEGNINGNILRKSSISTDLKITINQEGGWSGWRGMNEPTEAGEYYTFKAIYQINENGEFKKINSVLNSK